MAIELETGLPSIRQVQILIRDKQRVEIKLLTNDTFTGQIQWQDPSCINVVDENGSALMIWRSAIAYLKPLG